MPHSRPQVPLPEGYAFRRLALDDAGALAAAYHRNREHLARWDPVRSDDFYTEAGQIRSIRQRLELVDRGLFECWLLWRDDHIAGSANIQNIVRGTMQGGTIGYWIDCGNLRRGLAVASVEHLIVRGLALGLHRLEAGTMPENTASQRVLERCGFERYGYVPELLFINGGWRDHVLFNLVLHDEPLIT